MVFINYFKIIITLRPFYKLKCIYMSMTPLLEFFNNMSYEIYTIVFKPL